MTLKFHTNFTIKLVRHGQSASNVGEVSSHEIGDWNIPLTSLGHSQAQQARQVILDSDPYFMEDGLLYQSPYLRSRLTMENIAGTAAEQRKRYEDPRLREVEFGYNKSDDDEIDRMRAVHGKFFYRMSGGESPADCYDRVSSFIDTMMRQIERKKASKVLIVSHGLTIRCFVMRFLHLTIEDFDKMKNPGNCDVVTISRQQINDAEKFGNWYLHGMKYRTDKES